MSRWTSLITIRVASAYGERLRSWSADVASGLHPDSKWHDVAQVWQTPCEGEAFVESVSASTPDQLAPIYEGYGLAPADALILATDMIDPVMGQCILDLYRSATPNVYASWGAELTPTSAPGLVLLPQNDIFSHPEMSQDVADRLGARTAVLANVGHWWALEDPKTAADVISGFIQSV
jgi:pimeloyl-ACP methyl ester carboxylesterase